MSAKAAESVSPETLRSLEKRDAQSNGVGQSVGNLLVVIDNGVAQAIADKRAERDGLVKRVLDLNAELARLETHQLVGGESTTAPSA